jgi:hypothetical protein
MMETALAATAGTDAAGWLAQALEMLAAEG